MDRVQMTGIIGAVPKTGRSSKGAVASPHGREDDFRKVLEGKFSRGKVKFSAHAQERLRLRNIKLSPLEIDKIGKAVGKAADKGAKETLIILDERALVVSVKNNTVITVMDQTQMRDNVFTNIDSAVIL